MEGAFSYCNDLVMIVSEKEETNPNQLSGNHKQKHRGCHNLATSSSYGIFSSSAGLIYNIADCRGTFLAPEN